MECENNCSDYPNDILIAYSNKLKRVKGKKEQVKKKPIKKVQIEIMTYSDNDSD